MVDVTEVFSNLPKFTQAYVCIALGLGLLTFMGLFKPRWGLIEIPQELWNPKFIISYFYHGKLSISMFLEMYFFSLTTGRLEEQYKPNKYSEFFILMLFTGGLTYLLEIAISWGGRALLSRCFVMSLTYIYCKRNPNERMLLFYFITIKSAYLPFAQVALELLQGGSIWSLVAGIAVGHSYVFLKDVLPVSHRKDFLATPQWSIRFVNWVRTSTLPFVGTGGAAQLYGMNEDNLRPFAGRGVRVG